MRRIWARRRSDSARASAASTSSAPGARPARPKERPTVRGPYVRKSKNSKNRTHSVQPCCVQAAVKEATAAGEGERRRREALFAGDAQESALPQHGAGGAGRAAAVRLLHREGRVVHPPGARSPGTLSRVQFSEPLERNILVQWTFVESDKLPFYS